MNIKNAINEIESAPFDVQVNIASDYSTFRLAVMSEKPVIYLLKHFHSKKIQQTIANRIKFIANQNVDTRYENAWDTALSVYLLVAKEKSANLAIEFALLILKIKKLWWAKKISEDIFSHYSEINKINITSTSSKISSGIRIKHIRSIGDYLGDYLSIVQGKGAKTVGVQGPYTASPKRSTGGVINDVTSKAKNTNTVIDQDNYPLYLKRSAGLVISNASSRSH